MQLFDQVLKKNHLLELLNLMGSGQTLFQVVRESGLDAQEYKCHDCSKAIGSLFGAAKVCAYTKKYYCDECHVDETAPIPAKIVYNWNFQSFRVFHLYI